MMFLEIKDDIIVNMLCGDVQNPEDYVVVPDNFVLPVGANLRFFDKDYNLKPLLQQIEEGLITIPDNLKIVNNVLVEKSKEELITEGMLKPDYGFKYDDKFDLIKLTNEEKLEQGLMTQKEYDRLVKEKQLMDYESYLGTTDWYAIRFAETGKEIPISVKIERQNCRDRISDLRSN
jgi:hypothetical protein